MIRRSRSQRKMSDESLKRRGRSDNPPILAKVPRLENDLVTEEKLDENKINAAMMEKIEKIMKKFDRYRVPNQEAKVIYKGVLSTGQVRLDFST